MSTEPGNPRPPLAVEELARVALEITALPQLGAVTSRFVELVREWASPSALVAAVRLPDRAGWRVLDALCFGSVPFGVERALQQLVEELPDCLVRPTLQQPAEQVAGVKVRDNWIVPWWSEGESGLLFLRGVPRPYPPNLGEALALVSAPVWPRLLGGPAARVQALLEQLQQVSGRLQLEAGRELERLEAAAAAVPREPREEPPAPVPEPAADAAALARLEAELQAAKLEAARASEQAARDAAEAARLADEAQRLRDEAQGLRDEQVALSERLRGLEEQRGASRSAEARARVAEEALAAAQQAIASHAAALRTERTAASERVEAHRQALDAAEQRAAAAEQALAAGRDELSAQAERLESERAAAERLEEQRRTAEGAEARARAAGEALGAQLAETLHELAAMREERDQLRRQLEAASEDRAAAAGRPEPAPQAAAAGGMPEPVRSALVSLRRSAFVPAGLRLALEDVEAAFEPRPERAAPRSRIVILDRDLGGLQTLAADLEAVEIDVRIANYPEELALLLRTPAAREVAAAICDVMAFRPDQNIAGLFRSWEKDRPGLAFFLSYDNESQVEMERARRVPLSLTTGHLQRPLPSAKVAEAIDALARKQARS